MMALETILAQIEDRRAAIDAGLNACNADLARLQAEIDDHVAEKEALGSAAGALRLLVERRAAREPVAPVAEPETVATAEEPDDVAGAVTLAAADEPQEAEAPLFVEALGVVSRDRLSILAEVVHRNEPSRKPVAWPALLPPSASVAFPVVATAAAAEAGPPVAEAIPLSGSKAQLLADEIEAKLPQLMKIYPLGPTAKELSRHFGAPVPRVRDAVTRLGQKRIAYFRTQKEDGYLHLLPAAQAQ